MFARVAAFSTALLLATSVAATPAAMAAGSCNTGPIQCCSQVQSANSGGIITAILNLLNVVVDANAQIGFDCSPINVIGIGQSQCSASPVCCDNNNVGGLISIGCLPVKL